MKIPTSAAILVALTLLIGCSSHHKGPAYGHEQEFRQQVEASIPVQKWGYKIQDIRFTDDFEKALVVFDNGGKLKDVRFQDDGFHRYEGSVLDPDRMVAGHNDTQEWSQTIIVTLPDR